MDTKKIAHIALTALFVIAILPGAIMNIIQPQVVVEMAGVLGVPLALLTLLGVWKLLGVIALVAPRFERIKEWAYAGFFFDLTGAAYLHAAAGDFGGIAPPLVILTVLMGSYLLRRSMTSGEVAPRSSSLTEQLA